MAKKATVKKTAKEIKTEKRNRWLIILLAIFLVGTMVIVPLAVLFNPNPIKGGTDTTATKGQFNNIVDALYDIPQGATYLRFVNLTANDFLTIWSQNSIGGSIPNASLFGGQARKDALALYPFPTFGYFDVNQQWISVTDFGPNFDNASYTSTTVNGEKVRMINNIYAFSQGTYPVISGRKENVAAAMNFLTQGSASQSAYSGYSDLLEQIADKSPNARDAKFAVVGQTSTFGAGDRYYAGITPLNASYSDYKIVVHLNQTLNQSTQQAYLSTWTQAATQFGLDSFQPRFTDNYLIVEARGDTDICLSDLVSNWPSFLQG